MTAYGIRGRNPRRLEAADDDVRGQNHPLVPVATERQGCEHYRGAVAPLWDGSGSELSHGLPGRSRADFISKLGIVVEEADESVFWIQLMIEAEILPEKRLAALRQEAKELTAIFTASRATARKNDECKNDE